MAAVVGVDIGTYSSKGVLVALDGTVLAIATRPHRLLVPEPGFAEHRPDEDWWDDLAAITGELLSVARLPADQVKGIALSAIGPCMLPLDKDGRPLMNAVLYGVDTRAAAEIEILGSRIGDAALLAHCGNLLTSQSVGPKILWLHRNRPEVFNQAAEIVTATTYLVRRLTGASVIDHYSAAGFAPLYDITARCWSDRLADDIVALERLPRLARTTEIVGEVTPEAAAATGLAAGTPVTVGTIDAAAEAFSIGVRAPGELMLMYGSTIFTILVTAAPVRDGRLWYAPWILEGLHASTAGLATSGTLTHWFAEQLARELAAGDAIPLLVREAAAVPAGADGLIALPYFSGERTPLHDPQAKGCFFGLNLTHRRGHMFRAVLEGIAFGVRHLLEAYAEAGAPPQRVIAVGGGTQNPVWLQAVSDICNIEQELPRQTLGASLGDAMLAAMATGLARIEDVGHWNPAADNVAPAARLRPLYDAQYAIYRAVYDRTRDLMAALPVHVG